MSKGPMSTAHREAIRQGQLRRLQRERSAPVRVVAAPANRLDVSLSVHILAAQLAVLPRPQRNAFMLGLSEVLGAAHPTRS